MSLYDDLGVAAEASQDDVKAAYRKAAMRHHPDRAGGCAGTMQTVQAAYDVLGDKTKRDHYDRTGQSDIPDKQSQLQQRMMQLFDMALDGQLGDGDMVDAMKDLLHRTVGQIRHKKILREKDMVRLTKWSSRLTIKSGDNLYRQLAATKIAQCESDIAEYDAEIDMQFTIIEELQNYEDAGLGTPEYQFSVSPGSAMP